VEVLLVVALLGAVVGVAAATRGTRPPRTRTAVLQLRAALVETRALAMSNPGLPGSGATLSVKPSGSDTVIAVYKSRPIAGSILPIADVGFPKRRVPASIVLAGGGGALQPFSILVSSSGYASVQEDYFFDPQRPATLTSDPGCDERDGVAIIVRDEVRSERHILDCREVQLEASPAP